MIPIQPQTGTAATRLQTLPPLSLYIHFPWCVRKCPYCDFNSHEARSGVDENGYIDALVQDLEHSLPLIWGRPVHTVFMGGGTPSLFAPQAIDTLLAAIRARVKLLPEAEITLEANPGTVDAARFRGYRAAGVNRLSLGIQSFNPRHLQAIGRIHDGEEARRAAALAAEIFDTFNLDLMFALPGQTLKEALADVDAALSFGPPHLSCYHLTLEPNTLFYRNPPDLPDDDAAADMHDAIEARMLQAGFDHYETSAFARLGHAARHNLNYWRFGDYLGIGAGAHSKLSFPDRIIRQVRYKQPAAYLKAIAAGTGIQTDTPVSPAELPFEFMLNALRLREGFETPLFAERTGVFLHTLEAALSKTEQLGLIQRDFRTIMPTEQGRRYLNTLLQHFLSPARS